MRRLLPLLAAMPLAACTVGPNYRPASTADLKVPEAFATPAAQGAQAVQLADWWKAFGDAALSGLVERALYANNDVDAAVARLRQARASLRGAEGARLPSAGVSGSVARSLGATGRTIVDPTTGQTISTGGDTTIYRGGFDASWEADIFGGLRRGVEAAEADLGAARANLADVQTSIAAEVGTNYVSARLAQARLEIARRNLVTQDETVQIVGWRVQAGLVSSLDLEQARQLRAQTAATIPTLETNYRNAANRLAILIGEAPGAVDAVLQPRAPVPLAPGATDIPAQVIARRPDVAAAERSLAAETARIGVQTAELYPALRLQGSFSGQSTSIGNVLDAGIGNLVGAITAPIFQGGRIRAAIEGQRAATRAALASYRQTVLLALEEVENALVARRAADLREREIDVAAEAARNAVIYARSQYRAGLIDFQTLLDSERSLLSSQDNQASARADRATATVQLYKALGGGWQAAPVPMGARPGGEAITISETGR
ncbi:efflux transporter outer membrane subunit [Sphingomonas jatrophae]|uniref:Efflux transporter, outer membrane factor (OMF) lipoprotein, NodT family n=1 Tax=Sphingomonas jatrophae TaxID=1166337 RepID=A0A1I6JVV9_9SPHN|nr:efflux transporter outer membrane subunit [Sphingomonas jatrophae]SFR83083.1 efflux transporter, outer membrane factor (OMF) lipoprotein, NodT family [Sphingomonas jatrophae]